MPTKSRAASWLQSTLERPFARLVAHFAATIFEGETAADDADMGVGGVLGLLAVPGAFLSILLFDKYSTLLQWLRGVHQFNIYTESLPDKYFFIVFSMVITGVVVVLKWDRILPGPRDYANLAPLPISARRIFAANLLAILIAALVFAVDVNAASVVLYPIAVVGNRLTVGELSRFAGVQRRLRPVSQPVHISGLLLNHERADGARPLSRLPQRFPLCPRPNRRRAGDDASDGSRCPNGATFPGSPPASAAATGLVPGSLPVAARPRQPELARLSTMGVRAAGIAFAGRAVVFFPELPPMLHANFGIKRRPDVPPIAFGCPLGFSLFSSGFSAPVTVS